MHWHFLLQRIIANNLELKVSFSGLLGSFLIFAFEVSPPWSAFSLYTLVFAIEPNKKIEAKVTLRQIFVKQLFCNDGLLSIFLKALNLKRI